MKIILVSRNFSLMKFDHEKHFTGYVYINNKYQKLQDKCCLKSIFNLEI